MAWRTANMLAYIREVYGTIKRDPRTIGWSLTDPWPLTYISIVYLTLVLKLGPEYMKNKPPYDLKKFTILYNILQIVANGVLFLAYIKYEAIGPDLLKCTPLQYSFQEKPYKLAVVMWFYTVLKILEYVETVVFVLRKKQNQVTLLHVYHHVSTLFFAWFGLRYCAGGIGSFIQGSNCFIHILMYSYYLLSVCAPTSMMKLIKRNKKYLTMLQMFQFCLMIIHTSQAFFFERCSNVRASAALFLPNIIYMFYMFKRFFDEAYLNSKVRNMTKTDKF